MKFRYSFFIIILSTFLQCGKIKQSDAIIFKYNQASGITSLDPAFAKNQANIWACSQFFNGLVQLDNQMKVQASIAKSWEFSADKKSITFHLRNDVNFHENDVFKNKTRKVVAQDFVYSFSRIIDPKTASTGAWVFNGIIDESKPFEALDDSTFVLHLNKPFTPILGILSMPYCFVVPKEAIDYYGLDFRAHPIGTGPFTFKIWEEGTALVGLKNEKYFEKDQKGAALPYVDGFKVSFTESKKMEYLNFMKGELDMLSGIDKSFTHEVFTKEGELQKDLEQDVQLIKFPFLNSEYLGINLQSKNKWLSQKEFRQALNYCFNREDMLLYLRNGMGYAGINGICPLSLAPNAQGEIKGYSYKPEKAKLLLKQIGYDGSEIVLNTNETYKDMALFIANEAEKIGVNLKIEVVQPSLLREWMVAGQVDFFRGSWIADYPDAENYMSLFYSKNGAPPNYTRFSNTNFDSLYVFASSEENEKLRAETYTEMESILLNEAPFIVLYYDVGIRLTHKNINGLQSNGLNSLDIKYIKKMQWK